MISNYVPRPPVRVDNINITGCLLRDIFSVRCDDMFCLKSKKKRARPRGVKL